MAQLHGIVCKTLLSFFLFTFCSTLATGQSGKVFRDFNNNGIAEASEKGVAGISIRSFRADGSQLAIAVTDLDGSYSLSPAAAATEVLRIEFSVPDSLNVFFPGAFANGAGNNGTSVQFVTGPATDVNYAVNMPADFCEATPPVSVVCFVIGSGLTTGDNLIATIPYDAHGKDPGVIGHPNVPPTTVGSIWGTAYEREKGWLYSSSFMRRHTAFGPNGTGQIYVTTNPKDPGSSGSYEVINLNGLTVPLVTGGTVTINTGNNPHPDSSPTSVSAVYLKDLINPNGNPADSVGKIAFGDMDMSNDGEHLFVVSLREHRLYRIAIDSDKNPITNPTAADVLAFNLPNPGCTGGVVRPFGLGVRGDDVYVGMVCDASISKQQSDLWAYVYKLNTLTNTFSPVIDFSLNYLRGLISGGEFFREHSNWQPWNSDADWSNYNPDGIGEVFSLGTRWEVVCPQPILSDIVFDDDGAIILGFLDRFGHQSIFDGPDPIGSTRSDDPGRLRGYNPRAGGDVIRICNTGTLIKPVYELENLGKCGSKGGGQFAEATYSPVEYEYYTGDNYNKDSHTETADGGLGLIPGTNELIMSAFDPVSEASGGDIYSNGYRVLDNTTGQEKRGFQLLTEIPANNGNNLFGKASGVGGIEVLCTAKALEIGNRVWKDLNKNGIQDAGEDPIVGVILEIYNENNQLVGRDTTDALGTYYFNRQNVVDTVGILKPNRAGLQIDTDYTIRILSGQYNGRGTGPLEGLAITIGPNLAKAFADAPITDNTVRDNNGILQAGLVSATVHTGYSGENDHTVDLGFAPLAPCSFSMVLTQSECNSLTNQYSLLGTVLLESIPSSGALIVTHGNLSTTVTVGTASTAVSFTFTGLTSGTGDHIVTAAFSDTFCGPISETYAAPASCTVPATVQVSSATVCAGTVASLTATGCLGQLQWIGNGATNTSNELTIATSSTILIDQTLSYTVNCITTSSSASAVGSILISALPRFNGLSTTCSADGTTYTLLGSYSPVAAAFTASIGTMVSSGGSFTVSDIPTGAQISLLITNAGGCTAAQAINSPVCQTFCPPISAVVQTSSQTLTVGQTLTLMAHTTPTGNYTYSWSGPAGITFSSATAATVVTSVLSEGTHSFTLTVTTQAGCFTTTTVSVVVVLPVVPSLHVSKLASTSRARVGDVISYTILLTNSGTGTASNIVVQDSLSGKALLLTDSVTASVGTFIPGIPLHTWAIASIPANTTATLVYSASVLSEGIIYNSTTIPGDTARVCTSVPFVVCSGSNYAIRISGPAGFADYAFYNGNTLVYRGPLNSYTATAPGAYNVVVNDLPNGCAQVACCPIIIEEIGLPPTFTVVATNPTCVGVQAQVDGRLQLTGLGPDLAEFSYAISEGSSFTLTGVVPQPVPADGLVANSLSADTYTLRLYNKNGCFEDRTLTLSTDCTCPPPKCVPLVIRKIKLN